MNIKRHLFSVLAFILLMAVSAQSFSQEILGNDEPRVSTSEEYVMSFDPPGMIDGAYWFVGGPTSGYEMLSDPLSTPCTVLWNEIGLYTVEFYWETYDNMYYRILDVSVVNLPAPQISNPTNITATSFTANWEAVPDAQYYKLWVRVGEDLPNYSGVTVYGTSFDVTGLSPHKVYWYRVKAVGSNDEESEFSDERHAYYCIAPPAPDATLTSSDNICGPKTLTYTGSQPMDYSVGWYWQNTSTGQSTDFDWQDFPVQTSGTYYLRAKATGDGVCNEWTTGPSITVTINPLPATPATPGVASGLCAPRLLSKNGTPPNDVSWYWQGTNSNGTDHTSQTATASTFQATINGTNNYYLRARTNFGCWSTSSVAVSAAVDNPAPPNGNSFQYCEWLPYNLSVTGYLSNLKWYNSSNQLQHTGLTYTPTNLNIGNHTYYVKNVSAGGCEGTNAATVTLNVKDLCDDVLNLNWQESIVYGINTDGTPKEVAASRVYMDAFNNPIQSQTRSYATNQVFASQNIYDTQGNFALTTLSAPLYRSAFGYKYRFITNASGANYSASDFDLQTTSGIAGEVNNPKPVGINGPGSLGWYYSTSNTSEPNTAITNYPYSRSWSEQNPDPKVLKTAGPGDEYRMGKNHEVKTERFRTAANDLTHYYLLRPYFVSNSTLNTNALGYKYIKTDPDGKQSVTFVDPEGNTIATAILLPTAIYDYWSYTFYNDMGQIVASVAPEGVNTSNQNYPKYVTIYKYDYLGRLIEVTRPDEGTTKFALSKDGKIRFSQNQEQRDATIKRFSYTNYDYLGRAIESGEYSMSGTGYYVFETQNVVTPSVNSILSILENIGFTGITQKSDPSNRCSDVSFVEYDIQPSDFKTDAFHVTQENLFGQISKTEKINNTDTIKTWYNYDEFGQLLWTKQYIKGFGYKTIDYFYDYLGNVTDLIYQRQQSDAFFHHYKYDADQRLSEVWTSRDSINRTLHARYKYYLHGPLKRVELATDKQGIDYVYTVTGSLKSINNGDSGLDPGLDGIGGANASFAKDAFGETLHYYENDYAATYNAGTVALNSSIYKNQFGGNIRAMSYNNSTDKATGGANNSKRIYGYQYDAINELTNAQWGTVSAGTASFVEDQREAITSYDKHGNIQGLQRKGKSGQLTADYSYIYESFSNKLDKINNDDTLFVDYIYNSIGQVIQQKEGSKVFNINYNVQGLVTEVRNSSSELVLSYIYDDRGNMVKKVSYVAGTPSKNTFYIHDASGNTMAIYEQALPNGLVQLTEVPIYGTTRLGLLKPLVNTYFYEVNDHLGNVRAVIGLPEIDIYQANFESPTNSAFQNYSRQDDDYMDHTDVGTVYTYSQLLNGGYSGKIGLAKSLAISPGDKVKFEAHAKYRNLTSENVNLDNFAAALTGAFGLSLGPGEVGLAYEALQDYGTLVAGGLDHSQVPVAPKAYLNILLFDKNFNFVDGAYEQIDINAEQIGFTVKAAHDHMVKEITVTEPGYAFLFLSNENLKKVDVHFDDVTITHTHSPIVAGSDYYPFGLVMDGREINDESYRYGYQGQFSEKDLTTGLNEFKLRMYDARFGRWISPDPYSQFASPYVGMGNNPIISVDPNGGIELPVVTIYATTLATTTMMAGMNAIAGAIAFNMAAAGSGCPPNCDPPGYTDRRTNDDNGYIGPPEYSSDAAVYQHYLDTYAGPTTVKPVDTNPLKIMKMHDNGARISAFKPNGWQQLNESCIVGAVIYGAVNGVQLGFVDFFMPWKEAVNLDRTFPTQKERVMGFASMATVFLPGPKSNVTANRSAGLAFEEELAEALVAAGRVVRRGRVIWTPFGRRILDIEVWLNGKYLGAIECKVGSSRYHLAQRVKDWWLRVHHEEHIITNVARKP